MDASFAASTPLVHVVDDDDGFRNGMVRLLLAAGRRAVGYGCAGEFLVAHGEARAGCMLLDISMPGPSGVELMKALSRHEGALPVIFVTGRDDIFTSVDVMKRGAFNYLVKPVSAEQILPLIDSALTLDAQRRAWRQELGELRRRFDTLSAAERAVFHGVLRSKLNKQLAAELSSCERTVKAQRARMFEKLQVRTVPELVRAAKMLEEAAAGARIGASRSSPARSALPARRGAPA